VLIEIVSLLTKISPVDRELVRRGVQIALKVSDQFGIVIV